MLNKLFDTIASINQSCYSDNIIRFFKVHVYQGALEAMLSFYLVQIGLIAISSNHILVDKLILFVAISSAWSVMVFTCYIVLIIDLFLKAINKNVEFLNVKNPNITYEHFIEVKKKMKDTFLRVHKLGVISYTITALGIFATFYFVFDKVVFIILIVGFMCGVIWNFQDYFADNRLNCFNIFKKLSKITVDDKADTDKDNFKYTIIHTFISIVVFLVVLIIVCLMVLLISGDPVKVEFLFGGTIIKNAYILLFLTIIGLYTKTVFSLYNKKEKRENQVYVPITDFGCSKFDNEDNQ